VPVLQRAAALPGADHRALASHDYIDPLAHSATGHDDSRFGGRWLAGVARVGDTANVVVVQTRYTTVSAIQRLLWRALVASGAVTTCLAAALFYSLRRSTGSRRSSRN
jgi:hypothetical protein